MATAGGSRQNLVEQVVGQSLIMDQTETITDYTTPSASSASSEKVDSSASIDFSSTTGWTKTGTAQDIAAGVLSFQAKQGAGIQSEVYDLGSALSDTVWEIRFKMACASITRPSLPSAVLKIGVSSVSSGDNLATQDFIGMCVEVSNSRDAIIGANDCDGASIPDVYDNSSSYAFAASDVRYIKISRTSATAYNIKIYSDSSYLTLVETVNGTCASSTTGLRYFTVCGYSGGSANASTFTGSIDDLLFVTASYPASNLMDGSTSTRAATNSEVGAWMKLDAGSLKNLCALAFYHDAVNTTATSIKIQSSPDNSAWSDLRKITVANLAAGYNYYRFNIVSARYLRILAVDAGGVVLSCYEMKYYTVTDAVREIDHGHLFIDSTDPLLGDDGV